MSEGSGERPRRPFPALDPEPSRRYTWRSLRWPAVACGVAAAGPPGCSPAASSSGSGWRSRSLATASRTEDGVLLRRVDPGAIEGDR